jgi:DnaK suppressor protein|tara:strand:- start:681 stop:1034 length:354 start_codon:yes stop_codon:yes gene_type:complete
MFKETFLKEIKEILLQKKNDLLNKSTEKLVIDTDGDEIDEVQATQIIELNNQLSTRNIATLIQIESALCRLSNSTYGLCQDCEDEIFEKRLLANPYFLTCVSCAEEREIESKQRKKV